MLVLAVLCASVYIVAYPNDDFVYFVRSTFVISGVNINDSSFIGLSLKAACPFFFMQMPCFFAIFLLFAGVDTTPLVTNSVDVLIALSPLINPIITLAFLRDYRNFVLIRLRLKKPSNQQRVTNIHTLRGSRHLIRTTNVMLSRDIPFYKHKEHTNNGTKFLKKRL
ncbi:hypothetical protein OSTOST_09514 [Ostertagia ostertagi]